MGKITDFLGLSKYKDIDLNMPSQKRNTANAIVAVIIFLFASLYFGLALLGIGFVFLLQLILEEIFFSQSVNNMFWMIYGLIFGISFAFFVRAIPSRKDIETPKEIYLSFKHYFIYFIAFFTVIEGWVCIGFFIMDFYLRTQ